MKTISLFTIVLIISVTTYAQDFVYNGPAESEVKSFWVNAMGIPKTKKYAEGVAVLEAKMKAVKQKDPAYKTDKMEAEIAKWKAKAGSAPEETPRQDFSNMNPTQKAIKADQLLRKMFEETTIDVSASTLPVIQNKFTDYNNLLQQYLDLNTRPRETNIRRAKTVIEKQVYATNKDISKIEASMSNNTEAVDAEVNYNLAKYHQLYWNAAVKIFPEESSFGDEYKVINDFINKNGSLDKMKAGMDKNNDEQIKARKLPPAVMKDANAEKMMVDAFNKVYGSDYKGTAFKAVILQSDWRTQRNEITSVITGRQRQFAIVYKGSDGKCYLVNSVYLYQEYNGTGYTNTIAKYASASGNEILCASVK